MLFLFVSLTTNFILLYSVIKMAVNLRNAKFEKKQKPRVDQSSYSMPFYCTFKPLEREREREREREKGLTKILFMGSSTEGSKFEMEQKVERYVKKKANIFVLSQ